MNGIFRRFETPEEGERFIRIWFLFCKLYHEKEGKYPWQS